MIHRVNLYPGDSSLVLPNLEPNQFTACVCDPPYHLTKGNQKSGFMGKSWDGGNIAFQPDIWAKVLRVLKPGAMLLAFGGTRTFHRLACAIEDGGFEIRDCLMWLYGSGFPKALDISKALDKAAGAERKVTGIKPGHAEFANRGNLSSVRAFKGTLGGEGGFDRPWMNDPKRVEAYHLATAPATEMAQRWDGWSTALKPAWEPIVLAMKPFKGTFAKNAEQHGVAGLNIGGCRVGQESSRAEARIKHSRGKNQAFPKRPGECTVEESGRKRQQDIVDSNKRVGRWPANVLLDEEVGKMLDQQREASRFFFCAKASKKDRTCDGQVENNHVTVKPRSLMEYLCRLVTPPVGGLILDPFMGSGSTGIGALAAGNRFVGIELEPASLEIARQRIRTVQ